MPTCSQAKIITNLETDIHKRLYKVSNSNASDDNGLLTNSNENYQNTEVFETQDVVTTSDEVITTTVTSTKLASLNSNSNATNFSKQTRNSNGSQDQHKFPSIKQAQPAPTTKRNSWYKSRRISVDEISSINTEYQILHKVPIVFGDFQTKKDTVPINFLYNSSYRNSRNMLTLNQLKINALRSELNLKNVNSDGDDDDNDISNGLSDGNNSEKSTISLPEHINHKQSISSSKDGINVRNSIDYNQLMPIRSKRNSLEDSKDLKLNNKEVTRRYNSISHCNLSGYFTNFPKLALEVESIDNNTNPITTNSNSNIFTNDNVESENQSIKNPNRISLNQAKRLLALASIRPSKTFHKTMTEEEIEVLKKYYELIKPKASNHHANANTEEDKEPQEVYNPIVYDTAKVNFISLQNLKNFIESYKTDIESGEYTIDYDSINEPKGFILKNQNNESVVKFPNEINDTFFALAVSSGDKESQRLGEANLYRIINWNETSISSLSKPKFSSTNATRSNQQRFKSTQQLNDDTECSKKRGKSSQLYSSSSSPSSSPTSSTLSFEYIKNLSSLVSSVIQPKLLKQLANNGVDISLLPGGVNFEIPSFEELGINLNSILSNNNTNNANGNPNQDNKTNQFQTPKLKNTAYKKLKEKVTNSKVMWFSSAPERRPLSVVFELPGVEMDHETILENANKYLKDIGGCVQSLEFVPRSVHLGSVYVENLWILTLNDMNTKFFTITNGLRINDDKVTVKSYDEFIFSEYEKFVRNEKYKQLIKNHEKAIQNSAGMSGVKKSKRI